MTDSEQLLSQLTPSKERQEPDYTEVLVPNGTKHKMARWHSPTSLIDDIYSQNQLQHFTSIMLIGGMGSGKSTLSTFLAHKLHKKGGYQIRWFDKEDILNADRIFKDLPRSPHILIFNDVSQALTGLSQDRKKRIIQSLTTVRHDGKEENVRKVITIINVHYMFSFEKIWRSLGDVKIFTDIQREEVNNVKQFTGGLYNNKLDKFLDICYDQFVRGKFKVSLSKKHEIEYKTNEPFRICAVLYRKGMRFMLTWKDGCQFCMMKNDKLNNEYIDAKKLVQIVGNRYDKSGTAVLRQLCCQKGIRSAMSRKHWYAYLDVMKLLEKASVDWDVLGEELRKFGQHRNEPKRLHRPRLVPNDPSSPPKEQHDFIEEVLNASKKR